MQQCRVSSPGTNTNWPELRLDKDRAAAATRRAASAIVPVTQEEWERWFETNEEDFQMLMQSAPVRRRELNKRLRPADNTPSPVPRLLPKDGRPKKHALLPWQRLAVRRSGWFCLSLTPMDTATVFLYTHRGHTFLADISHLREGKVCVLSPNDIMNLLAGVVPIHRAEWHGHQVVQLLEARMRGTATTDGVRLEIIGLRQVTEPVRARRRKKAASSARKQASGKPAPCAGSSAQRSEDSSESSAESSDSDGQQMCALEEDVRGSSGGSSCPSVDTDAESGLDDLIDEVGASDLDDAHEAQDEEGDEAGPGGPLHQRGPGTPPALGSFGKTHGSISPRRRPIKMLSAM